MTYSFIFTTFHKYIKLYHFTPLPHFPIYFLKFAIELIVIPDLASIQDQICQFVLALMSFFVVSR